MIDTQLAEFFIFAIIINITPGQDMALITHTVITHGKKCAYYNIIGMVSAAFIHAALAVFGVSKLFQSNLWAVVLLKIMGACYLAFIGISGLYQLMKAYQSASMNSIQGDTQQRQIEEASIPSRWFYIRRGFLSTLTNVKISIFFLTVLTGFIRPTDSYVQRGLLLASIQIVMATCWLIIFASFLGFLRQKLLQPRVRQGLELATSFVMLGLSLKLFVDVIRLLFGSSL